MTKPFGCLSDDNKQGCQKADPQKDQAWISVAQGKADDGQNDTDDKNNQQGIVVQEHETTLTARTDRTANCAELAAIFLDYSVIAAFRT